MDELDKKKLEALEKILEKAVQDIKPKMLKALESCSTFDDLEECLSDLMTLQTKVRRKLNPFLVSYYKLKKQLNGVENNAK